MEIDRPITIAILLFVILVLVFYLVMPKYRAFQDFLVKIGEKEAEFQAKDTYFVEITKTYKELMQYQDSLEKIDTALPSSFLMAPLVNFIYQKGAENGLIVQRIGINKGSSGIETNKDIKETNISLSLFGSYKGFKNFLASLEKSARLIEGNNFSFSVTPPSSENPKIQETFAISLTIKVYSY